MSYIYTTIQKIGQDAFFFKNHNIEQKWQKKLL